METLKQLGAFVGWLSGSLAGVTGILYGAGFVATLAQVRLLGLEFDFASHDAFHYIARGGNVLPRALLGMIVPAVLVMVIAGITTKLASWLRRRLGKDQRKEDGKSSLRSNLLLLLAIVFVSAIGLGRALYPGLGVTGLLFAELEALCAAHGDALPRALIHQDREALDRAFFAVTFTAGAVLTLVWVGVRRNRGKDASRVFLLIFAAAALIPVIAVPVAHGLYGLRTDLPVVTLTDEEMQRLALASPLRLLSHGAGGTLFWLPLQREVLWLRAGSLEAMRVGAPRALFETTACPKDSGHTATEEG